MNLFTENTKITAPQLPKELLTEFREFKQNFTLSASDFYDFMTVPSVEREEFIQSQTISYHIVEPFIEMNIERK